MPIRPCVFALAAFALSGAAIAQDPDADPIDRRITEILEANAHELTLDGGAIGGPGGELLLREARRVRFVCLGEIHLVEEIPALTSALLRELRDAFTGDDEALRRIDALQHSGRVYRLYGSGRNYESNNLRIDGMKRHFVEHVRGLDEGERVVMRFGAMHMGRGYSQLHQQDLGNAASEIGVLLGGGSLHVKLTGLGTRERDGSLHDFRPEYSPFDWMAGLVPEDGPVVIDLRPLRPIFHNDSVSQGREALDTLVWEFDLVVIWPELTRATPLPGVPSPPRR